MEQRDILKEQIEQLGRVLGKIISKFLDLKAQGNVVQNIQETNQQFKSELDLDIDKLLTLPKVDLADYVAKKKLNSDHLVQLVDYVEIIGEHQSDTAEKANAFNRALDLLEIANAQSDTYDMSRQFKAKEISNKIQKLT